MTAGTDTGDLSGKVLLEKLKVIRKLGGGGMGAVYEVEHLLTGHRRALKVVAPKYVSRPNFARRLIREASVAGKLRTPYVVETFDAGMLEDGSAYVLMELLEGRSLLDLMQGEGKVKMAHLASVISQVLEGVSVAHKAGIIHRDLKPENIFLVPDGTGLEKVKILDFGISHYKEGLEPEPTKLTAEGTVLGTPFYMSPEQAAAKAIDERTDVYAVGVIMYEALTGRLPFESKSVGALFIKIHAGEYLPVRHLLPDVDPRFEEIVHRAMHRDIAERYPSCEALRNDLLPFATAPMMARAKTLSDGQRSSEDRDSQTIGEDEAAPPAAVSRTASTPGSGAPPPRSTPGSLAAAAAPAAAPAVAEAGPAARGAPQPAASRGTWLWGGGLVAAALVIAAVVIASSSTPPPSETGAPQPDPRPLPTANPPPVGDVAPSVADEPRVQTPVAARDAGAAAAVEIATPRPGKRPGKRTRAEEAGLDPNPYQ